MRLLTLILLCALATAPSPVLSADPGQIFSSILGEIGRQIEREQQRKQLRRLRPLWNACAGGELDACDRAARFPNLNDRARADIARMREAAELRPAYERNFYACQKMERAACQAALAYPYLSETDRVNLQNWQRKADEHHNALAAVHQNQNDCYAGSIAACTAAIGAPHLDASVIAGLERQRAQLQAAERRRQAQERQRDVARAALHRSSQECYAGSIAACTAAISNVLIDAHARRDLETHLADLQRAERQRRTREQQRQAAVRAYLRLRKDCAAGQRQACQSALSHDQVRSGDIAFLKQRDYELAPFTERMVNFFTHADPASASNTGHALTFVLLGAFALVGAGFVTIHVVGKRTSGASPPREPPPAKPFAAEHPTEPTPVAPFPLTGHLPTDVRRVLADANP
jgi:hypothetical protein